MFNTSSLILLTRFSHAAYKQICHIAETVIFNLALDAPRLSCTVLLRCIAIRCLWACRRRHSLTKTSSCERVWRITNPLLVKHRGRLELHDTTRTRASSASQHVVSHLGVARDRAPHTKPPSAGCTWPLDDTKASRVGLFRVRGEDLLHATEGLDVRWRQHRAGALEGGGTATRSTSFPVRKSE